MGKAKPPAKFDGYAQDYATLVEQSVATSGESPGYFARYKLQRLLRIEPRLRSPLLDYGCGTGSLTAHLADAFSEVHGFDPSEESVRVAQAAVPRARFHSDPSTLPSNYFGTTLLSGVLHHVAPDERLEVLHTARESLVDDGNLIIFEHNPRNPLTRHSVDQCPFDDDAVLLPAAELRYLVAAAGFKLMHLDYIVFFPRPLSWLRGLEPRLRWCGLGAQTMTVARKSP